MWVLPDFGVLYELRSVFLTHAYALLYSLVPTTDDGCGRTRSSGAALRTRATHQATRFHLLLLLRDLLHYTIPTLTAFSLPTLVFLLLFWVSPVSPPNSREMKMATWLVFLCGIQTTCVMARETINFDFARGTPGPPGLPGPVLKSGNTSFHHDHHHQYHQVTVACWS